MPAQEQEIAGQGCILQFFKDLYDCIDYANTYKIALDEIQLKYPVDEKAHDKKIPDSIQLEGRQHAVNAKMSIMRCQIQLIGISEVIKGFELNNIQTIYNKILNTPTPEPKDCQDYVTEVYKGFIKSILPDMLKSVDVYQDLIKE